jgi:hypothetical protein
VAPGVATGVQRAWRAVPSARDGWRLCVHMEKHRKLEQCESTLALGTRCQRYGSGPLQGVLAHQSSGPSKLWPIKALALQSSGPSKL